MRETEELARKRDEQLKLLGLASNSSDLKAKAMTVGVLVPKVAMYIHGG